VRSPVRWEEMFPDELDEALRKRPVVYLTYGLCEPHGLYNAVGLDGLKAHLISCAAAERHGGVVAPPFFWHIHEMGLEAPWGDLTIGDRNPWLTSLPPWVFYKSVWFQFRTVAVRGFHAAIVLTGHSPYEKDLRHLADVFMRHSPLRIWAGSDSEAHGRAGVSDGHAGRYETSIMWALRPDLVDMSRLEDGMSAEGVMAGGEGARTASRREGARLVDESADWLGAKADQLLASYEPPPADPGRASGNDRGAMTFDEAERLWRQDVEPLLKQFVSFQTNTEYGSVAQESPWANNERSSY
jgi:creatinine amidohydrolase